VVVWASGLFFPRERHGVMAADNHKIKVRRTNWLTPVALVILREESSYGYELMERLEEFGFAEINAGTLYRTLRQMGNEGLCESEWETSEGGPARRMYATTDAGESYLAAWAEGCKAYQNVMDCFLQAYTSR
jgi:PadR family transcriptional regulator, regulatory protein PadR